MPIGDCPAGRAESWLEVVSMGCEERSCNFTGATSIDRPPVRSTPGNLGQSSDQYLTTVQDPRLDLAETQVPQQWPSWSALRLEQDPGFVCRNLFMPRFRGERDFLQSNLTRANGIHPSPSGTRKPIVRTDWKHSPNGTGTIDPPCDPTPSPLGIIISSCS